MINAGTNNYYNRDISEVLTFLNSGELGLSEPEVKERLKKYGFNKLKEAKKDSVFTIFVRQFQSPLIYVLFAAGLAVFLMGEIIDGAIIFFVLFFNAVVGSLQEGKAQNTLQALKRFIETQATVLRDGKETIIPDYEVVPGDVLVFHEGEKVAADARLIDSRNLRLNESALTGESEPVSKHPETIPKENLPIAEQANMVFKGSYVIAGAGRAVVVATGLQTFIGRIAEEVATLDTETPLKANIRYLSRLIVGAVLVVAAVIFFFGFYSGLPARAMFATVVSLAVSIIPEGLPIVLTLVLATGVWRMSKRNALVKKLQAVEALGQARVIAVDKTGTITCNEMVVRKVFVDGKFFEIGGTGFNPQGEIRLSGEIVEPLNHEELVLSARIAAFCANARVVFLEAEKMWKVAGDPTEAAMLVFAEKIGFRKHDLEEESPLVDEAPFDYKTKYHATSHKVEGGQFITFVGAPEVILSSAGKIWQKKGLREFTYAEKKKVEDIFQRMLGEGLRVVAFAFAQKPLVLGDSKLKRDHLKELAFVGFYGIEDSLRPEVKEAVYRAREAGIRVVMITGDHRITAEAIAKEADIFKKGDMILVGDDLDKLSNEELDKLLFRTTVFARVTPEHKIKIIEAFKRRGEIVAMTGDGVNDAPSLVAADLGVAMGRIGTEVAKEAADIILLDDNFGSIVAAVEEGRSIYKTIKKVILYLFSTSIGEALTIAGAIFLGYPLPLLPAQIIWLNLVTDSFLDVALAMEPKEEGLLKATFERSKRYLVDRLMIERIIVMALPMMIGTLFLFKNYLGEDLGKAWTISLTTLAAFQWFNVWNCRREDKSVFSTNPFSNKFLLGATAIVVGLQLVAIYTPFLQGILRTEALELKDWLVILFVAFSIVIFEEIRKAVRNFLKRP